MKTALMTTAGGNPVKNQYILTNDNGNTTFQSYNTLVASFIDGILVLDSNALHYSKTTSGYLYQFTGLNRKGILDGIKSGLIKISSLN